MKPVLFTISVSAASSHTKSHSSEFINIINEEHLQPSSQLVAGRLDWDQSTRIIYATETLNRSIFLSSTATNNLDNELFRLTVTQ